MGGLGGGPGGRVGAGIVLLFLLRKIESRIERVAQGD